MVKMASVRRTLGSANNNNMNEENGNNSANVSPINNDPSRELFEACRNGDINKVKKLVNSSNVNAKDTAGRKSSPLHFAAGIIVVILLR